MAQATREPVDFVIVGSGAAGGIMAKELSTAGFSVILLEQGPHLTAADFRHDEWAYDFNNELLWGRRHGHPQTFRRNENETAQEVEYSLGYAHNVGGSSIHFSGNFWRLRPIDFMEASVRGTIPGTTFTDWPISYDELEPYYTKVDWEIGVSGLQGPWDPPRSRDYPCPPMPIKSSGAILERGCAALGYSVFPAPVAILSTPYNGRPACIHCGFCNGYGCEVNAKSSSAVTMIPLALASGNCELRTGCTASQVITNETGRVTAVNYWDENGTEHSQRTNAAVLCANGAETPRLLLLSESSQFPDGLANSSGMVGKNLMFNGYSTVAGLFEEPVNAWKSVPADRVTFDHYELDSNLGFYGGGGIDSRHISRGLPMEAAMRGDMFGGPGWGSEFKRNLRRNFHYSAAFDGHTTSLPLLTNSVSLDPNLKDKWDRPALRCTYTDHPDDTATMHYFLQRSIELMEAAGATQISDGVPNENTEGQRGGVHLLGTCRMGSNPATSVIDKYHRSHDIPNLFLCDGSSMVTSGRGQPTMTIMAMAFRAADHIIQAARQGDV
ncbi:MAG: GMC family oxidoreductase [Pseudohongiellaceae bacterium]